MGGREERRKERRREGGKKEKKRERGAMHRVCLALECPAQALGQPLRAPWAGRAQFQLKPRLISITGSSPHALCCLLNHTQREWHKRVFF